MQEIQCFRLGSIGPPGWGQRSRGAGRCHLLSATAFRPLVLAR